MAISGLTSPNYGQMGMEADIPQGTGAAAGYGNAPPVMGQATMPIASMQGGTDSAKADIGYSSKYIPQAGRADRSSLNIVGGAPSVSQMDGGYRSVGSKV